VRDASAVERLDVPTAFVYTAGVTGIAEATRCLTGLAPEALVPMELVLFGKSREEIATLSAGYGDALLQALGLAS
jgi:hypothetical protein